MKIENFQIPKSSFLSLEKDLGIIVDKILSNRNLQRLLYYPTKDALHKNALTTEQQIELFGKHIKIVPKVYVDKTVLQYVIITFDFFNLFDNRNCCRVFLCSIIEETIVAISSDSFMSLAIS